jgi:RNA polymerase sigma factor (sigma-70 family)
MDSKSKLTNKDQGVAEACRALVERRRRHTLAGDIDDNVQNACLRALEIGEPQTVQNPVHYLSRITRNLFIDKRRRQSRDARLFEHSSDVIFVADEQPSPEKCIVDKQLLAAVLSEIDGLPPRCRETFLMHRFENMSYPAIAKRMGISVSMVEKHVAAAMLRLERVRKREEGAPNGKR